MLTLPQPLKPRQGTVFPPLIARPGRRPLRIRMVEPTEPDHRGSMGCRYVINAAESAGFAIDYHPDWRTGSGRYDVELVSLHHCTDYPRLASLPRLAPIRLVGGHPTANNVRPAIPFGDAFCVGEGEEWIIHALSRIAHGAGAADLADLPGTIVPRDGLAGMVPRGNVVDPLPRHPPYLNRAGVGHARVWYLEMARGCPFHCHFCELGWAWKYRAQDTAWLLEQVDGIDRAASNRISLFAPDEASHPGYAAVLERIHERKLITSFGSMRLDVLPKRGLPLKRNMLVRVGLDGLTEATRTRVGKRLSDDAVWEYFRYMSDRGHSNFKIFMIFGYPWETQHDVQAWEELWARIARIPRRVSAHVRIKFTPFIPQPSTPLGGSQPRYDHDTVGRILAWFARVKSTYVKPGWFVVNDGIMSERSHSLQCRLTLGDEATLLGGLDWSATETLRGYDVYDSP